MTSETTQKASTPPSLSSYSYLRFLTCSLGICICYWFYGFLQEKLITKSRLGATFMLVIQTATNIVVALVWQRLEAGTQDLKSRNRSLNHLLILSMAIFYAMAMVSSNESLKFVSYPVAVLAKSIKMVPNMIFSTFIEKRRYSAQQWIAALCISVGIALFHVCRLQKKNLSQAAPTATNHSSDSHYWKGIFFLCLSLGCDGCLSGFQGLLKRPDIKHNTPTAVETMLYINFYALFILAPIAIALGQWDEGIRLLLQNEQLQLNVLILNLVVGIGQVFIFLTITWYSSLVTTTITTTRKFFTILFSVMHFGHSFSFFQWLSVVFVFLGLFLSISSGQQPKKVSIDTQKKQK